MPADAMTTGPTRATMHASTSDDTPTKMIRSTESALSRTRAFPLVWTSMLLALLIGSIKQEVGAFSSLIVGTRTGCIQMYNRAANNNMPRWGGRDKDLPFYRSSGGLCATSDGSGGDEQQQKKRRRKRKDATDDSESASRSSAPPSQVTATTSATSSPSSTVTFDLSPRDDTPVQMQVQNVRDVVTGGGISSRSTTMPPSAVPAETKATTVPSPAVPESLPAVSSSPSASSFEQLLEDARRMKEQEAAAAAASDEENGSSSKLLNVLGDSEGAGIKQSIGNALSLLVTADFFLVCAFLVWFLLGIFCSSVLKNDFVQIQFNNNFERLVQPALGVLMIASIGSNFFAEKEDENGGSSDLM